MSYFSSTSRLCHVGSQGKYGGNEGFQKVQSSQCLVQWIPPRLCVCVCLGHGGYLVCDGSGGTDGCGSDLGFMIEVMA